MSVLNRSHRAINLISKHANYQQVDHQSATGGAEVSFTRTSDLEHREMKAGYYAMIDQVDTEVGRMLKVLD